MIVKVIVRENDFAVWDKEGNRLYFSDQEKDIKIAREICGCTGCGSGYFTAYWKKKVVQILMPTTGYSW